MLTAIAYWFAFSALLFGWLHFGRRVPWSDVIHFREGRRLR